MTKPTASADETSLAAESKRGAEGDAPVKVPNPPEGEVDEDGIPDETPKLGSRDAPGG